MAQTIVYITGFRQHAGKTVTSLGLARLLCEVMEPARIGYIKPVGQRSTRMPDGTLVDEDALVIERFAGIPDVDIATVSPVRLEAGFTKEYLSSGNTRGETRRLSDSIRRSIKALREKDIIIAEGTGHPGVGAIVGLSNAEVGNLLGAQIIFLSGGGIGKALDMLEVDLSYFYHKGSNVRGILFNRLYPDKILSTKKYVTEGLLSSRFRSAGGKLSILGYLPEVDCLSNPTMKLLLSAFSSPAPIGNTESLPWRSPCEKVRVLSSCEPVPGSKTLVSPGELVILSARTAGAVGRLVEENRLFSENGLSPVSGIIITDSTLCPALPGFEELLADASIPVFSIPEDSGTAEEKILALYENTKLQVFDSIKAKEVRELFKQHFDMDKFMGTFGIRV
jgi:dethiobiotin synthetase